MKKLIAILACGAGLLLAQTAQDYGGRLTVNGVNYLGVASGTNTYTVTPSPVLPGTALQTGVNYTVKFTNANTGASTLAVGSFSAVGIVKNGANATALVSGDVSAGSTHILKFDGTNLELDNVDNAPGGAGTVTSVATGCGLSGGTITTSGTLLQSLAVAVKTTNYTILGSDMCNDLDMNSSSGQTFTLPQAGTTGFEANKFIRLRNIGTGTTTVSTTTSTFVGGGYSGSSLTLSQNQIVLLQSDGTNWNALVSAAGAGSVTSSGSPSNGQMPVFTSGTNIAPATAHNLGTPRACADSSGSGTAQSCTTSPTFTPASGDQITYSTTTANSGDLTINVNSTSAVHVRKWMGAAVLASGDLPANTPVTLTYDGTYWEIPTIGNAPSGGSAPTISALGWFPWGYSYCSNKTVINTTANRGHSQIFTAQATLAFTSVRADVGTADTSSCTGGTCGAQAGIYTLDRTSLLCATVVATNGNASAWLNIATTGAKVLAMSSGADVSGGVCTLPAGSYLLVWTSDSTTLALNNIGNSSDMQMLTTYDESGGTTFYSRWGDAGAAISTGDGASLALTSNISSVTWTPSSFALQSALSR